MKHKGAITKSLLALGIGSIGYLVHKVNTSTVAIDGNTFYTNGSWHFTCNEFVPDYIATSFVVDVSAVEKDNETYHTVLFANGYVLEYVTKLGVVDNAYAVGTKHQLYRIPASYDVQAARIHNGEINIVSASILQGQMKRLVHLIEKSYISQDKVRELLSQPLMEHANATTAIEYDVARNPNVLRVGPFS